MKCPKCQFDNPESVRFCGRCGTALERICQACEFLNPPDFIYCGGCGRELAGPRGSSFENYSKPNIYTPRFLAEKILTTRSSIEGERKVVTVFFADVAGYTAISEKLDPEEAHQIMDGCFKILMDEIHRYEGTVNQFTGDGVMALFGAPIAHEDHAQRACRAALSIQKAMEGFSEKIRRDFGVVLKLRIGLNSGPVVVGSIGDDLRMDYTAGGDTTNLAARMESLARPGTVFVSGHTFRLVSDFFEFVRLGKRRVKGREEPVEVYELIRLSDVETRIEAAAARGLTKFVDRQRELKVLRDSLERARSGSGQVVGIVGEAGVGKSRLVFEFRHMLPQDDYIYLEGRCLPYGETVAYLPIVDLLRSYFQIKEGEEESSIREKIEVKTLRIDEGLKDDLPPLHELLYLPVEDEAYLHLEPRKKRERIFRSIRELIIRESQNKTVVVVVESVHWIDSTSEELLTYFIDWLAKANVLLIVLYRPEYRHEWANKSYYTQISLEELSTETVTELVQAILGEGSGLPRLGKLISNRTGGNPLFIEELTHSLLEKDIVRKEGPQHRLTKKDSEIQVPDTIQGIIAARIDSLHDRLKRVLQFAAVIGRDFTFGILECIAERPDDLKSDLLKLQALGFIYEKRLFPELEYTFKHALFQEVAYNSLLVKSRKQIHENVGNALEEAYPERLEEYYEVLAYHYSRSKNAREAYHYLKLSGNKATKNHSLWEAFRFYGEAIGVLKRNPQMVQNEAEQIAIRRLIMAPMRFMGYPDGSLQILQEGESLSKALKDKRSLAAFYSGMGHYFSIKGKGPVTGIIYTERCFREAERIQDIELLARAGFDLCVFYNMSGQFVKLIDVAKKVIAALEEAGKELDYLGQGMNIYSVLHAYCGRSMGWLGDFDAATVPLEKGLRFALDIGDRTSAGWIEYVYGRLFTIRGDGNNAIKHFKKAIQYTSEVNYVLLLGLAWTGLGWGYYLMGQPEMAKRYIQRGLKIQSEAGISFHLALHFLLLGILHLDSGDLQRARKLTQKALTLSIKHRERHFEGYSRMWLGRILGKTKGSTDGRAEKHILQGIKISEQLRIKPHVVEGHLLLGELHADRGQGVKAIDGLKKAEEMFQQMKMHYWLARTREVKAKL